MATKPSSWFLSKGFPAFNCNHGSNRANNVRFISHSHLFLPVYCKTRQRNLGGLINGCSTSSSRRNKRQQVKKASPELTPATGDFQSTTADDDSEAEIASLDDDNNNNNNNSPRLNLDVLPNEEVGISGDVEDIQVAGEEEEEEEEEEDVDKYVDVDMNDLDSLTQEMKSLGIDEGEKLSIIPDETKSLGLSIVGGEQPSRVQLEDLIGMIRNAEKNILLLNQARVSALEDLERILTEKELLQGEINVLEMRLAETDARMKVAAQEKIQVELMEDQLEKLRNELAYRGENQTKLLNEELTLLQNNIVHSLSEELNSLKTENASLKNDIEALKGGLSNLEDTDKRVITLEKERMQLDSSLKDLESKLSASQGDVAKLSSLKVECKDLWEKVENLQASLDKATKQADQAIQALQQNQELRKKVDKLEESLEEANVYKLSSEKLQQYNVLMQQKIKLLDERLERSDEEIRSSVQLYQDSIQEFQETLNSLKEQSKKKALDEPVDDMPWEFWSRLLLIIDGWLLENKIAADHAKLLRDMAWKRERRICNTYFECREKNEREAISMFLKLTSSPRSSGLYVIHIAAEMAPVAKVGGLGDVVAGLGKALQKRGHLVEVILPKYDCMQYDGIGDLRVLDVTVESYFDGKLFKNKIWVGTIEGLPVYFIEPHHPDKFFWRGQFYGEHDDFRRFSFFSRAALELLHQSGKKPDIIHCHDWQTAFVAPLYWDIYAPKGLNTARICFTCHNFEYQGTAPASELVSCGLDVQQLNRPDRMQDNTSHDKINAIKGAVVFSNIVTTVSPTYAQEVRTAEGGRGLHSTLNFHAKKFIGILNGIDTDSWNPATDTFLNVQYNANDLQGKAENKLALREHLGLSTADPRQPLVGCITRLVPQKGVHLIRHAIYRTLELGGQFLLLGSSPVPHIQREFEGIANHFQNHEHIRLILKYDESLSRSIYAASDMFIIPSIFEPCGLTQMIAMKYGSIPIVRKTGGLNDSVFDVQDDAIPVQFRNGFTFLNPDEQGINNALERAFSYYKNDPEGWQELVQKVMHIDFSWESSASQYEDLYSKSAARAKAAAIRA